MTTNFECNYILCLLIALISCQSKEITETSLNEDIDAIESRNTFLEEIYKSDQGNRAQIPEEYDAYIWQEVKRVDSLNLIDIDKYLEQNGYPDTINYTKIARMAPWIVIQHCPNIDTRNKYYDLLKQAFKNGKINEGEFYLYLARNYHFEHGEILSVGSADNFTLEEKILIFQEALGYE